MGASKNKCVYVYIYKRYDTDLLSMYASGYPITAMMRAALISYCNSIPFWFFVDDYSYFDLNDRKSVMIRFTVPLNDRKVKAVLANIKHGYISNFCKAILRNSFINQTTSCYYSDKNLTSLQMLHSQNVLLSAYPNVHPISQYKGMSRITINIDGSVSVGRSEGVSASPGTQPLFATPIPQFIAPAPVTASVQSVVSTPAPAKAEPVQTKNPVQEAKAEPVESASPVEVKNESSIEPAVAQTPSEDASATVPPATTDVEDITKITLAQNDALFAAFDAL